MADNVKIDLDDSSKYRVTLELARTIMHNEKDTNAAKFKTAQTDPRAYLLELYAQCRKVVVEGSSADYALKNG